MTGIDGIIDDLNRSLEGNSWQGSSIREILAGVAATEAVLGLGGQEDAALPTSHPRSGSEDA